MKAITNFLQKQTTKPKQVTKLPEFQINIPGLKKRSQSKENHKTKLGGNPDWIQNNETPTCRKCNSKMVFISQIDSLDCYSENAPGYIFGDCGMIYVFICMNNSCNNWDKPIAIMQYY